jgi:hypothetical protein
MKKSKTDPRVEAIGEWEYFRDTKGNLYRGLASQAAEARFEQFMAPAAKAEFVLRCARMAAGLPEWGSGQPPASKRRVRKRPRK